MGRRLPENWGDGYRDNAARLDELTRKVDDLLRQTATKREIEAALQKQTGELDSRRRARYTFRLKLVAACTSALIIVLQIYTAVQQ